MFRSRAMNFSRHWETMARLIFPLMESFSFHKGGLLPESKAFCHSQGILHSGLHTAPTSSSPSTPCVFHPRRQCGTMPCLARILCQDLSALYRIVQHLGAFEPKTCSLALLRKQAENITFRNVVVLVSDSVEPGEPALPHRLLKPLLLSQLL